MTALVYCDGYVRVGFLCVVWGQACGIDSLVLALGPCGELISEFGADLRYRLADDDDAGVAAAALLLRLLLLYWRVCVSVLCECVRACACDRDTV